MRQLIAELRADGSFMDNVIRWHVQPAVEGVYDPLPEGMDERLRAALQGRGITQLYHHQRMALDAVAQGRDVTVVTPTASGKTLCYNLPVLSAILQDDSARALYLFPTKALAQDQVAELYALIQTTGADIKTSTYDGDTPATARTAVRQAGHVVVTNPDMLHSGILPLHTKWVRLFENLRFIVIDEVHVYRGVFGAHMANVLRRLLRICAFYGSNPRVICCSATIKNPKELAEALTGRPMFLVDRSWAPCGEKHVVFYNPPVINKQLGIRKGAVQETRAIGSYLVGRGVQTILFARSRLAVEVLVRTLKGVVQDTLGRSGGVRGYRGGYLPSLRREIEKGLRSGEVRAVVSTNALELGIDIGQLQACVLCGYPGSVASMWQRAGRAGRRQETSLTILIANSSPIDQYIVRNPDYLLGRPPEMALVDPDNLHILLSHIKCAAYEIPFERGELYGGLQETGELLSHLTSEQVLRAAGGKYYWQTEEFPASEVSLRTGMMEENFLIVDITRSKSEPRVMGEMDRFTVPMLLHEKAVYLHEGNQYQVEELDFDNKKAYVRRVDVDYYTDANMSVQLRVLDVFVQQEGPGGSLVESGEVLVSSIVTLFKKFKLDTQESLGFGPVNLPQTDLHTQGCWLVIPEAAMARFSRETGQTALVGLTGVLQRMAPMDLLCDEHDIRAVCHIRDPFTGGATVFFYDVCPGGIGLSEALSGRMEELLLRSRGLIETCPCEDGCPSCVGAASGGGAGPGDGGGIAAGKGDVLALIDALLNTP